MTKFYSAIILLGLIFSGYCLHAQNANDQSLLNLVKKNAAQLNISPADADNVMISYSFTDSKTNIQYVYLQQAYQNIKVYNSIKTVIFRNNEVLYSSGKFIDSLEQKAGQGLASPAVQAEQAINNAAMHLRLPIPLGLRSTENKFATEKKMIFSPAGIAKEKIETELLWVAADDGSWVKLAWNVNIDERRSSDWWNVRIDAATGAFLEKNNWTVHEKRASETDAYPGAGNVLTTVETDGSGPITVAGAENKTFTQYAPPTVTSGAYYISKQPSESPRHNPMVLVNQPWLAAGAGNAAITNGWHFDGTTNYDITRGNNVHAYLDVANSNNPASGANTPVVSTTPIPALTFNFVPNFTQQPNLALNRQAAVTNLFYWNNTIHDILYQYGFNEASGNFQTDNLGRGGLGNDYVQAEAQDASGTDNANFGTPADGQKPRMQMFLWSGVPTFTVNTPAVVAGNYFATESGFSTANKLINVGPKTGQVVYYNDDGTPAGTHFACNGTTPGSLAGKIAMIIRGGGCVAGFIEKVKNAQNNGAIAVIMVNNVPGFPITMGGTDNTIIIPAVMISQADGALLAAQLGNNLNVTLTAGVGIDGDFDNGVVTHEYGHGVSNRLTGGAPNSGCLNNAEQGGEGWSDYLGLMLTTNWATATTADGPIARPMAVYAVGQPLNGTGIRTYPYSTDMTINPHTYTNVANPAQAGEVHYIGEIWCATVWDMTWNIIQQEGTINPNIYDGTVNAGNSIALRLVMEGMRLQTCRPGFLDARDAIIAADSVLYNGRHKCSIWAAFARRGMGLSAVQGSSNNTNDGIAAFDVPSSVQIDKKATPLTVIQGEKVTIGLTATCQCQINTGYTLRDTIPAGFTYVSSTGGTLAGNVVTFPTLNFSATQETKTYSVVIQPNNPGCAIATNINDNRDGSTVGGFTSVIATGATNWVTSNVRSTSPTTSWFAASNNTNRDFSLTSGAAGFTAGSLSVFSFKQFFITKNTIEGGRVEYSTNGGTTWLDAGPFIIQKGYNNISSVATPWGIGQKMFGGVSYGRGSGQFINTIVDLSSLSGQNVRLRLRSRGTTTNQGTFEGWYVDDLLQMDGCGGIVKAGLYDASAVRVDSLASPVFIVPGTPILITTQPNNITVCNGSNAVFTAAATPATSPTYQWQRSIDAGVTWTDLAGETNAALTVTGVTLAMNGYQYRVIAYSSISSGFVISNPATLNVNPIPTVNAVGNQTLCRGATTTAISFTGTPAGTVFNWTNNAPAIGLAASGSGNIAPFVATNNTGVAIVATITVTPSFTAGGTTCLGTPTTFTITVNPNLQLLIVAVPGTTLCQGDPAALTVYESTGAAPVTITHSSSNAISAGIGVSCGTAGVNTAINSYWRAYDLTAFPAVTSAFTINSVNFGIEQLSGGTQLFTVRLYTQTGAPFPGGTRTQIASQTFNIPVQALTIFTATLGTPVTVPNNSTVVVEVEKSAVVNGQFFFPGGNAAAETGPSYISTAACGIVNPVTYASIGFPNTHLVMALAGTVLSPSGIATGTFLWSPAAGLSSTTTNPVAASPAATTTYTVVRTTPAGCVGTANITLNVNLRPTITSHPANATVCGSSTATFTVTGTGTGITYQWQEAVGAGPFVNIPPATAPYTGTTTPTLTINPVTVAMTGNRYRCVLGGVCPPAGTANISNPATLSVNALPVVTLSPSGQTCGGGPTFCNPITASGANIYTWSPVTGLFLDCTATVPYTAGTNAATVYPRPTVNTVYTVTGTNTTTGCSNTATISVVYTPAAPVVTPAAASMCFGDPAIPLSITSSLAPITTPYCSGPINLAVPDNTANGVSNTINVTGIPAAAVISNVSVTLNMSHTYPGDMILNLKAPNGQILNLYKYGGGLFTGPVSGVPTWGWYGAQVGQTGTTAWSTVATAPFIYNSTTPWKPDAINSAVVGATIQNPTGFVSNAASFASLLPIANGGWTLALADGGAGDVGTLASWCINFTYGVPATGVWTPNGATGTLYTDPAATIHYTGGAVNTVYALPSATTTYNITVSSIGPDASQTFTNSNPIIINDGTATPYPANLVVTGLPTTGSSVKSVTLCGISHTWSDDIDIVLQSPTGVNVILMSDVGAANVLNNVTYTFDDSAGPLNAGPTGTYHPTNVFGAIGVEPDNWPAPGPGAVTQPAPALAMFGNINQNGTWKLFVFDDAGGDVGTIGCGYSITFAYPTAGCVSPPRTVVVTVNTPIAVTSQPVNATVCTDKVTSFTVAVTGTSPTYQWQVSTDNGNTFANISNGGVYSGATAATLVITAPPLSMNSYQYRVIINGAAPCASATSFKALLTVNPLPSVVISASPYTRLLPGLVTTLSSTVTPFAAGTGGYLWLRNGVQVAGANTGTLNVTIDNLGDYSLRVTDIHGCTNTSNTVTIADSLSGKCFIYPNPSGGQFQVRYFSALNNVLPRAVVVYDTKGDKIFEKSYIVGRPYDRMDVDLRKNGKGLYWVEVLDMNGKRITMCRVVIQ